MAPIIGFIAEHPISILQLSVLVLAYYQLRWTRIDTAHPRWKVVEISSLFETKEDKATNINVWIMNVGKGRAENVEYNVSIQDADYEAIGKSVSDLVRAHDENVIYRKVVNPGGLFRVNFRLKEIEKINQISIRVKDENGRTHHLFIDKEDVIEEKKSRALLARKQPYRTIIRPLKFKFKRKLGLIDSPEIIGEIEEKEPEFEEDA